MVPERKIRVLHSIYCLGRGGLETWLMNLVRLRSHDVNFDFHVGGMWGGYEEEAQNYGCLFHYEKPASRLTKRLRIVGLAQKSHFLSDILANHSYDVFHIHGEEFMGDALKIAAQAGVPVRVAHCHSTSLARGKTGFEMWIRSLRFRTLDRARLLRYATDLLACSNDAGQFFMGRHWEDDPRCHTLYCGIALDQFEHSVRKWKRNEFRAIHGIPEDAIVIGHVGSMGPSPVKNHAFIIEIFKELARRSDRYHLYLAGDGPLRPSIETLVRNCELQHRVSMPGLCEDVPSLMVHGFDVHLLPSLREGLPLVGLEAVAAGLVTTCTDTITRDYIENFPSRVCPISLTETSSFWASKVEEAIDRRISVMDGIQFVAQSPFTIKSSLKNIINIYSKSLHNHH